MVALKILCSTCSCLPPPHLTPGSHCPFDYLLSLPFPKYVVGMITVLSLAKGTSFTQQYAVSFMSFHGLIPHFSILWMYHHLFIHSPTKGHLGCFQVWAIMNKAAINIHVQVFCMDLTFQLIWVMKSRNAVVESMVRVRFVF